MHSGPLESLKLMLAIGANPRARGFKGETPLMAHSNYSRRPPKEYLLLRRAAEGSAQVAAEARTQLFAEHSNLELFCRQREMDSAACATAAEAIKRAQSTEELATVAQHTVWRDPLVATLPCRTATSNLLLIMAHDRKAAELGGHISAFSMLPLPIIIHILEGLVHPVSVGIIALLLETAAELNHCKPRRASRRAVQRRRKKEKKAYKVV